MVEASEECVTPEMMQQFSDPDEFILFQERVSKLSRWNMSQSRILAVTVDHVYLFSNGKLNRKHRITNLAAIIKSNVSSEIVLHFPKAKDLRITGLTKDRQKELQNLIQMRYANKEPVKTLSLYGIENKSLKEYAQDNVKYGFTNLPDPSYRLRDEEIKGSEDDDGTKVAEEAGEEMDFTHIKSRFSQVGKRDADADQTTSDIASTTDTSAFSGMGTDFRGSVMMKRRTTKDKVKLEDFEIKSQLGRGTFGRVYLSELSTNKQLYAIKAIRKDVLI